VRAVPTETNIVMLDLLREADTTDAVIPKLKAKGVLCVAMGLKRLRACTHLDVSSADADKAAQVIAEVLR
jgi:threonine aldolase